MVAENKGINLYAESDLHASLKRALAHPGDRLEARIGGKIVDLVRMREGRIEELVEIQTAGLGKIQAKVLSLSSLHPVRLIHPLIERKRVVTIAPGSGEVLGERMSPKRETVYEAFRELAHAVALVDSPGITVEFLFVRVTDIRIDDGKGSWRRRGKSQAARILDGIYGSRVFASREDWLSIIPSGLPSPFGTQAISAALGIPRFQAARIAYVYKKAALFAPAGKEGRAQLYRIVGGLPLRGEGRPRPGAYLPP